MRIRVLAGAGLALLSNALVACGDSSPKTGPPMLDVPSASTSSSTVLPSRSAAGPGTLPHTAAWTLTTNDGYTSTVTVQQGDLARAAPGVVTGDDALGSGCPAVSAATDAVIPFSLTITSTTAGFAFKPSAALVALWPNVDVAANSNARLFIEFHHTSGSGCATVYPIGTDNKPGAPSLQPNEPLTSGQSVIMHGWLIVTKYYSPANPNGTPVSVRDAVLTVDGTYTTRVKGGQGTKAIHGSTQVPVVPWNRVNIDGGCLVVTGDCH
jgi:hypothetical protein